MSYKKLTTLILNIVIFLLFMAQPAFGHKVNIFAYAESGVIYTEAYFPDGQPVSDGEIEVFDSNDKKNITGTTDKEGKFSFPISARDDLTIVINASMGHKNSFILKKDEID